jgi:hypothetical protein
MLNDAPKFKPGDYVRVRAGVDREEFIGYIDLVSEMDRDPARWNVGHSYKVVSVKHGWYTNVYEQVCEPVTTLDMLAEI